MNIGGKIALYKDKLGHKNYAEFGKAAGLNGNWINDLSKREEIKQINDMSSLIKLCRYLDITIDQLVINDDAKVDEFNTVEINNIDNNCDDIGTLINETIIFLDKQPIKMDGMLLNNEAKQTCKDALMVVKTLTKQYL